MQLNKNVELVLAAIEAVIYQGGDSNYVTFDINDTYYIQISASKGDHEIYCEAVSDYYLQKSEYLSDHQISALKKEGWLRDFNSENYHMIYQVDSEKSRLDLAKLLWKTAVLVYNCKSIHEKELSHSFNQLNYLY